MMRAPIAWSARVSRYRPPRRKVAAGGRDVRASVRARSGPSSSTASAQAADPAPDRARGRDLLRANRSVVVPDAVHFDANVEQQPRHHSTSPMRGRW